MVGFWGEGKPEYPEKTSRCRVDNQQTQPIYDIGSNPDHIGGRRVLSPLRHPCTPKKTDYKVLSISPPRTHKTVNLIPTFENEKPKHQPPQCYSNDLAFRVQTELFVTFIGIKRVSTCNKLQSWT